MFHSSITLELVRPQLLRYTVCQLLITQPTHKRVVWQAFFVGYWHPQFIFKIFLEAFHIVNVLNIERLTIRVVYEHSNHTRLATTLCQVLKETYRAIIISAIINHVVYQVFSPIVITPQFYYGLVKRSCYHRCSLIFRYNMSFRTN